MPAIRGLICGDEPQGRPFRRQPGRAGVRQLEATCSRWRRSAPPAPTISCAPRSGRWWSTSIRRSRTSTRRSPASTARVAAYRADYAAYYERCKRADSPGHARPERGGLSGARRRHAHLRQGQGDGAHRRRVLRQRHQRHARRVERLDLSSACPSRRPSTSSTGCSRRPSSSACRSRRAWPAGSRWSPAAPAASAGRPPTRLLRRGRLRRARRHRRRRARRGRGRACGKRYGKDVVRPVADRRHRRGRGRRRLRRDALVEFGGLDILVSNAGIASSAPIEETTLDALEPEHGHPRHRLFPRLARGLPAVPRRRGSAARSSSSPPRTASPPRPAPRPTAPPRPPKSTSPAAWRSKARRDGIRVNVVNPDAVLRGSQDLERRVEGAARRRLQDRRPTSSRSIYRAALAC